ncbi:MAG: esterase/lipase family protein, partial [Hyphomicrobiaceae bacterium]
MKHIILPHGLDSLIGFDTPLGPREWDTWRPSFEAAGYLTHAPSLGTDNPSNANIIASEIASIPAGDQIYIVAHSMGGLSSRYLLKNYETVRNRVSLYLAIDSPQFGTWNALKLKSWCPQITPPAPFIVGLNSGSDQTPGTLPYVQLTIDYPQLLTGVYYKALEGVTHRDVVTNPAT